MVAFLQEDLFTVQMKDGSSNLGQPFLIKKGDSDGNLLAVGLVEQVEFLLPVKLGKTTDI
ncbi:hypothetical protein SGODD07_01016 [Streptococcus gordonii]|uniref:Uncharacterized protein n=1 Tax=Streptococcus gordonii TaxID=1302 RepID=A0A139N7C6_STRGN|nr:hypothetical protein SGODD07_01016 [Streptococcus gordonii]